MEDTTPAPDASGWGPARYARLVQAWTAQHGSLLDGLVAARSLGEAAAVEAILAIGEVRRLRLSWELWEAMRDGCDPDSEPIEELRRHLGDEDLGWCRLALWGFGEDEIEPASLRLVV